MTMVLAPGEPSIRQSWLWKGSERCCLWGCRAFPGSASLRIHSNLGCFFPTTENPSSLKWKAWDKEALPKLGGILAQGLNLLGNPTKSGNLGCALLTHPHVTVTLFSWIHSRFLVQSLVLPVRKELRLCPCFRFHMLKFTKKRDFSFSKGC